MKQAAGPPKQEVALPGDRPRGEERTDSLPMAIHGLKQTTAFSPMLAAGRTRRPRAGRGGRWLDYRLRAATTIVQNKGEQLPNGSCFIVLISVD